MHAFRDVDGSSDMLNPEETLLSQTTLSSFLGIEERKGLTKMAERIIDGVSPVSFSPQRTHFFVGLSPGSASIKWAKGLGDGPCFPLSEGHTLALNAFQLSSLPNGIARKQVVKQMWESGASILVCNSTFYRGHFFFITLFLGPN